ncbi:type III-B CRISPR module RAMP protein Cmr1, partial [Bathymodiolus thermophilus thioautotrophic gill symbiont]|uniref:type III-B CRISPR module RAMP protein Cmr1 n=1 Tax=Bathymodiolus thermophilus thioautotrophic gill symbiont TaxID=2360 RepID=UPI001160C553
MKTIVATYRIITPMFISGAKVTEAELRIPSIKGAIRFWWRALNWQKKCEKKC